MAESGGRSKQLIADAALAEFAMHGFAGARTDRIAGRAGVNKQLIYYYYGSKAKLFEAVSRSAAHDLSLEKAPVGRTSSATEKLRTRLEFLFEGIRSRPELAVLMVGRGQDGGKSAEWGHQTVRTIAATISEGQGLGFFRDDIDPLLAARQAMVLLAGYVALQPIMDSDWSSAEEWFEAATQLLLRSLTW
jgi:TetR/AcrR family transcriptional regulator